MAIRLYTVWKRYRRKLGPRGNSGDWDIDSGLSHAVVGGRTLCGRVPLDLRAGWERDDYRPPVTCERCRRSLADFR